jgi:hypothetical protein
MATVNAQDMPSFGRSRSVVQFRSAKPPQAECGHCGSSLATRAVGVRRWGRGFVRVYSCPCGHDRRVPVEGLREAA